jgi:hypothetical protein
MSHKPVPKVMSQHLTLTLTLMQGHSQMQARATAS